MRGGWLLVACVLLGLGACENPGGGRTDAGVDGGTGAACSLQAQDCPAGEACTLVDPGDGGRTAAACRAGACDVVAQGCGEAKECRFVAGADGRAARTCTDAQGEAAEGQPCVTADGGVDTCATGLVCVRGEGNGPTEGSCRKYCHRNEDCGADFRCISSVQPAQATDERPRICERVVSCDPLTQNCAGATQACYLVETSPLCRTAGQVALGQACAFADDCVKGATCVRAADGGTFACRQLCNPADGGTPACPNSACDLVIGTTAGVCRN
jgi:hypothetical protein